MFQPIIDYIKDKSVLVLGFGREGRSTLAFIRRYLPEKQITVADCSAVDTGDVYVNTVTGENYLDCVSDYDIVFKSPGIPFIGVNTGKAEITCQLDMMLRFPPFEVVGITGTKGKTTTTTLIYEMLKSAGKNVCIAGNIGIPVFDIIDGDVPDIAVIEMSSHQLEFTTASPHIAVLTNIYEEHLDHYAEGFNGYMNAKLNIARFQKPEDYFIFDPEQLDARVPELSGITGGSALPMSQEEYSQTSFASRLAAKTEHLAGRHNLHDIAYAVTASRLCGAGDEAILRAIEGFNGIEHRMEFVGDYKGIRFYNDSIATAPFAVMSAIEALGNVGTLLFGGLDRGIDYSGFIDYLAKGSIGVLIGLPDTGHTLLDALKERGCPSKLFKAKDMQEAVELVYKNTATGKSCLFSPAAASYNVYKNFEEKGGHYKSLVKQYGA